MIELYSKNFFKEYFYEYVLELQTDSVPNVRLRLCSFLLQLKKIIKLPTDRNLLQQLESCVRKILLSEKDRDVLIAIKQVNIIIVVILYILSRAVMVVIVLYLN